MINLMIRECGKLVQKEYKTRHDSLCKVILWELCKKLKFDHTKKSYMHKPESVLENKTHKLHWDFEIQTDHLISARRPGPEKVKKKKKKKKEKAKKKKMRSYGKLDFAVPTDHRVKLKEGEKKDKYQDLAWELKNYETWKWWWYQLWLVLLVLSPKDWYKDLRNWK